MCDYSLHGIENRLAVEGEILVVHRFSTGCKGLTSPSYLEPAPAQQKAFLAFLASKLVDSPKECAVCIPDGARLQVAGISTDLQKTHGISANEAVVFRQLSEKDATFRDALEFGNGVRVTLQYFMEGTRMKVRCLSGSQDERENATAPFTNQRLLA
ncbi:MAG TPA: hypothetical protein VE973_01215 [Candidatus Limnocylindria bacterium]|nr:hypothetical protein [Candidatus Limnocylindria bacterium]